MKQIIQIWNGKQWVEIKELPEGMYMIKVMNILKLVKGNEIE